MIKPCEIGLPPKFEEWREGQWDSVELAVTSEKRFVVLCAPTGSGKSVTYISGALLSGMRTAVLTSTKGLQSQLMRDFESTGLVDIRGMNNYDCLETAVLNRKVRVEEGPCHAGYRCAMRSGGCSYYDAVKIASRAPLVVTNYAYWMNARKSRTELGEFDLLVLDEAHDALDCLSDFLHIELTAQEVEGVLGTRLPEVSTPWDAVKQWAGFHLARVNERLGFIRQVMADGSGPGSLYHEARVLKKLGYKLDNLAHASGEWVAEEHERSMFYDPVWPGEYAEGCLFTGVPHVMLVSATVRPKTVHLLNVLPSEVEFRELTAAFPAARRPVIHIPTVRMNRHTSKEQMRTWLRRIDQLIEPRLERKGIVHTVSYKRRNEIVAFSDYRDAMVTHDSRNTAHTVERFKSMEAPAILVSPSVTTGYDFPFEEARWQIIGKLPYPDTSTAIMKARTSEDSDYTSYLAAQTLVQMCGRGMRAEDDVCESLVIDDNFLWFVRKYRDFLPRWFMDAVKFVRTNPEPIRL